MPHWFIEQANAHGEPRGSSNVPSSHGSQIIGIWAADLLAFSPTHGSLFQQCRPASDVEMLMLFLQLPASSQSPQRPHKLKPVKQPLSHTLLPQMLMPPDLTGLLFLQGIIGFCLHGHTGEGLKDESGDSYLPREDGPGCPLITV